MNSSLVFVAGGLAFFAAFLLYLFFRFLWETGNERLNTRLQRIETEGEKVSLRRRVPKTWAEKMDEAFETLILQSGLDLKPNQAVAWMILVGTVLAVGAWFLREELWLVPLAFAVGGGAVLGGFFWYHLGYRDKLQDQLPDSIYLLSRSLRAGMSLEQALELIGKDGIQPLASEFKRCSSQIKLGLPITIAMENMAQRLQMVDLNALVSTISVFQTTGGNLPMLLDRLASSARDRSNMRIYFRTATAMARVSIVPIALALPAIVIAYIVWEPQYVEGFMETGNGRLLIAAALAAEFCGLFWLYRLLRFDY